MANTIQRVQLPGNTTIYDVQHCLYTTCSTEAATAAKTVSITEGPNALYPGLQILVNFANQNTANSPTLKINSLDAKNIYLSGVQITTGVEKGVLYNDVLLSYNGTGFNIISQSDVHKHVYYDPTEECVKFIF